MQFVSFILQGLGIRRLPSGQLYVSNSHHKFAPLPSTLTDHPSRHPHPHRPAYQRSRRIRRRGLLGLLHGNGAGLLQRVPEQQPVLRRRRTTVCASSTPSAARTRRSSAIRRILLVSLGRILVPRGMETRWARGGRLRLCEWDFFLLVFYMGLGGDGANGPCGRLDWEFYGDVYLQ